MPTFSQTLTLKEAFETAAQLDEEVKKTEFDGAFCKKFKLLLDRFSSFFSKTRKNSIEKMTHRKRNGDHRTSNVVKSTQSYSNGHLPYRGIFVYKVCLISIRNSVSDGATNKSVLNIESS